MWKVQYKDNRHKCHDSRHVVIFLTLHMIGLCQDRLDGSLTSSMGPDVLSFGWSALFKIYNN